MSVRPFVVYARVCVCMCMCVQRIVFDLGKILFTDIIDLTLVERESTTLRYAFLPFLYSSFHNLAFVRNIIHQCQQSGCFLSRQPCRKTSTFVRAPHPAVSRPFTSRMARQADNNPLVWMDDFCHLLLD